MFSSFNLFLFTFLSLILISSCTSPKEEADRAIQTAVTYLFLTYDEIHVREIQTVQNPDLNKKYKDCGVAYTKARNAMSKIQDFLKSGDYKKLPSLANFALQQTQNCDKFMPQTETEFKKLSLKAIDVCKNVLEVTKRLA